MLRVFHTPRAARVVAAASLLTVLAPVGCDTSRRAEPGTIRAVGSNTMVNMAQMWAEAYRTVEPAVTVKVLGGSSGIGIAKLIAGEATMANASRALTEEEKRRAREGTGKEPVGITVAYDALAVYVHKDNPIQSLTLGQLAQIFGRGREITSWSQLGVDAAALPAGTGDAIVAVGRQPTSGTYVTFHDTVLKDLPYSEDVRQLAGSAELVQFVAENAAAIGYSGMGYKTDGVKFVKLAASAQEEPREPSRENVRNHTYPLARPLRAYTLDAPAGAVKAYVNWILSSTGQEIVGKSGFISVSDL